MIEYKSRFNRNLELWFDEPEPSGRFDVVVRYRALNRGTKGATADFYNLHVDLSRSEDEIFAAFARNTRAQIKKSIEHDGLSFEFIREPTLAQLREFIGFYNNFAMSKGLSTIFEPRMLGYLNSGGFSLSRVLRDDEPIVWHSNVHFGPRVGLMHSASHFRMVDEEMRKLIGRANRRLHWEEMLFFKRENRQTYDFGGWYEGTVDRQRLMVNRFKEEFGGKKVLEFTVIENRSLRAKVLAIVRPLLASAKFPGRR